MLGQRGAVQGLGQSVDRGKRAFAARQQEAHHVRRDPQLAVGQQLHQQGAQQGLVGRRHGDGIGAAQPRAQVGQLQRPARRRQARRQQQMTAALDHRGPKRKEPFVEQPAIRGPGVECAVEILQQHRLGLAQQRARRCSGQGRGWQNQRSGPGLPDRRQVALARPFRAVDHQCRPRPSGPGLHEAQRRLVGIGGEEVLAPQPPQRRQADDELPSAHSCTRPK